ncbi:MAG: hypothetical protein WCO51_04695 [bacterium]|jgi:hypothetical protein
MGKANCWEVKNCGRQSDGPKVKEFGVCPAANNLTYNNMNSGKSAGRYCWKVAGTLCGGKVQGTFADKMSGCLACPFFAQVKSEEAASFRA